MKKTKFTIIIINIVLIGLQVVLATARSHHGGKIADLRTRSDYLATQNSAITTHILELTTLSAIETQANALTLVKLPITALDPVSVAVSIPILP